MRTDDKGANAPSRHDRITSAGPRPAARKSEPLVALRPVFARQWAFVCYVAPGLDLQRENESSLIPIWMKLGFAGALV